MTRAGVRSLAVALRPRPFEVVAIGGALIILAFLRLQGLHYGWNTFAFLFPQLLRGTPPIVAIGIALRVAQRLVTRRPVGDYLRAVFRPAWLLLCLRCWVATMFIVYGYTWLKVSVPLLRSTLIDPQLWHLDRLLHFGLSPSVFAIDLVAGTPLA